MAQRALSSAVCAARTSGRFKRSFATALNNKIDVSLALEDLAPSIQRWMTHP